MQRVVIRNKMWVFVQRCLQKADIDYEKAYALVARLDTIILNCIIWMLRVIFWMVSPNKKLWKIISLF